MIQERINRQAGAGRDSSIGLDDMAAARCLGPGVSKGREWQVGGEDPPRVCLAACLMTDAERYTTLSESMEPRQIVELINEYYGALFGPISKHGGVVSDVKGDGLLAVWNSDYAGAQFRTRLCMACVELLDAVDSFNDRHPADRLPTRLGVDFGPVALARVGALARYEYRAVGDPVNTAHRLEELNKELKTHILMSDVFTQGVSGFLFRDLGSFRLRGKRCRTRVCELVGRVQQSTERQRELCRDFGHAVTAYEIGNEVEASKLFRSLHERFPEDGPTLYYLQRLAATQAQGEGIGRWPLARSLSRAWLSRFWPASRHAAALGTGLVSNP
jgi:adenylate cyclase